MKLKKVLGLIVLLNASMAHALPSPQFVPLMNTVELGKFIDRSMNEIIRSSSDLARAAYPNEHYFLVTTGIEINPAGEEIDQGTKPMATLTMSEAVSQLSCKREIFVHVQADRYGENRKLNFSLAPEIHCKKETHSSER